MKLLLVALALAACEQEDGSEGDGATGPDDSCECSGSEDMAGVPIEIGPEPAQYEVGFAWFVASCTADGLCRNRSADYESHNGVLCHTSGSCDLSSDGEPSLFLTTW